MTTYYKWIDDGSAVRWSYAKIEGGAVFIFDKQMKCWDMMFDNNNADGLKILKRDCYKIFTKSEFAQMFLEII